MRVSSLDSLKGCGTENTKLGEMSKSGQGMEIDS